MAPGDFDALLFDLGGVIIDIDFQRVTARWAALAGRDPATVRFTPDEPYRRHEVNAISDARYFESLRASLGLDLTDTQILAGWNAVFVGEVPGIADLLARAARRLPLYVFSNTNPAHEAYWSARYADVLKPFRKLYVSSRIGLRKPTPEAFRFVANDIGLPAQRILFFDDMLANVEGARACGLQAVHVRSSADVAKALEELGL